jgi:DNA primase
MLVMLTERAGVSQSMTDKIPAKEDWQRLVSGARQTSLGIEDSDPVPHGTLVTEVAGQTSVDRETASRWIENATESGWLKQRGSGSSREYVTSLEGISLYDTDALAEFADSGYSRASNDEILEAMEKTVSYYHNQLTDTLRDLINMKWGIQKGTIDDLRIGYAPQSNELPEFLRENGVSAEAALSAGVVRSPVVKHVYEGNTDDLPSGIPEKLEEAAAARDSGEIKAEEISLSAVLDAVREERESRLYAWWDARIIFPYRDDDGQVRYLIARKTGKSDDVPGKYLKLANTKPWVDRDVVYEPIYGCGTVEDGDDLIMTEGITDAIRSHEVGFACVSPVTKQFKRDHYDVLQSYAERSDRSYICFDAEESGVGLDGALRTSWFLVDDGIQARVAELPRSESQEKVDLAEYLKDHDGEDLRAVLDDAVRPDEHPQFDPDTHAEESWQSILEDANPEGQDGEVTKRALVDYLTDRFAGDEHVVTQWIQTAVENDAIQKSETDAEGTVYEPDRLGRSSNDTSGSGSASSSDNQSQLFKVSMRDVVRSLQKISEGYRGKNPYGHWGDSENYFVVETYKGDLRVRDYKADYTYTPVSLLAVASGARSQKSPSGSLSDQETFAAWKHAKEQDIIDDTDPIPWAARLHIARTHDLAPKELTNRAVNDPGALPATIHNRILDTVEDEYDVNPGKDGFDTDHKAEARADLLEGGDDQNSGGDEKGDQIKRMLATLDELDG